MRPPSAPPLDKRRTAEFFAELQERAHAWIPEWGFADAEHDFGRALLEIAARFNSEVAERFDRGGKKMRREFLDWLAVRGEAARPSRVPVVFKLVDAAREPVLALPPVRMQADASGTPVVFETEKEVRVVPGRLDVVVGVDADQDAFYLPAPGMNDLKPLEPLPTQWQLKSFAAAGATKLQLDPEAGLVVDMIIETGGAQYRITQVDNGIVTIDPPLDVELSEKTPTILTKVVTFAPFDGDARNRQEHALYLGHMDLLNIEASATIDVVGAAGLVTGIQWQYWGKVEGSDEVTWQPLKVAPPTDQKPDALVLTKPQGAVEPKKIGDINSRWIRAYSKKVDGSKPLVRVDTFQLRINCDKNPAPCPPPDSAEPGPTAEAMANNTPLVLSEPFYPLGREPRQFDAFYLGSAEAFSKKGADAQICFEMSDATCRVYTPVHGTSVNLAMLAGVGKDRALHLFRIDPHQGTMTSFRGPLRPPLPTDPATQPIQSSPVELNPLCKPVIWTVGDDFFVAVAAGGSIWVWHEYATDPKKSGWSRHSTVPNLPDRPADIVDIIVLQSHLDRPGAVLSNGRVWVFDGTNWTQPEKPVGTPLRDFAALVPIYDSALNLTNEIIAVSTNGDLFSLKTDATETPIALSAGVRVEVGTVPLGANIPVGGIRPAAIVVAGKLRVVAVRDGRNALIAVEQGSTGSTEQLGPLAPGEKAIGAEVAVAKVGTDFQFSVGARKALNNVLVASWIPTFIAGDPATILESQVTGAAGDVGGTPLFLDHFIVVPGSQGDAFVAPFDPNDRLNFTTKVIGEGVILPAPAPFAVGDFLSALTGGARDEWTISKSARLRGTTDVIYVVESAFGGSLDADPKLLGYVASGSLPGTVNSNTNFTPNAPDPAIVADSILRIEVAPNAPVFCAVDHVDGAGNVFVKPAILPGNAGDPLAYWKPQPAAGTVVPAIEFDPFSDGNWDASILDTARLYFPTPLQPSPQSATAFGLVSNHPSVVALNERWTSAPPPLNAPTPFIIDGLLAAWRHQLADTSSNPALSWEYWNGKGWWSLQVTDDGTQRLANTGTVNFKVPQDIAESDWSGKTNFWIRARLVGGDYGQEEVKVVTKPGANPNETVQTVERSTENIKAPQVLDLSISYRLCNEILPTYVLAQDSGSILNKSDANNTLGAFVEAFIPLNIMLGALAHLALPPKADECPPQCTCGNHVSNAGGSSATIATNTPTVVPETGRALFVGLNATLAEPPVNVLLLVEERDHTLLAPLRVEALVADGFVPIVVDDTTRALGESGVLSMAFALPPKPRELFGKTLSWFRLVPTARPNTDWKPKLRGAYLNAVWASATESLTRELLGSSDGSPNLVVRVARPPVLLKTLELRVREPLGEEEREELLKQGISVLTNPDGLQGDWVLWTQVTDPGDESPGARVYSLDETNGVIQFGDGQHGMIPPIGVDSIVAFRYARTEVGSAGTTTVPGNTIKGRTPLNLVSPVESVEAVVAADQAAGGAPPEPDERVLRFGFARLRHRNRAVTARDIEDLALQSSPEIVQARADIRRAFISLVVVMRGKNPTPNAAQVRELRRLLLASAPVSLSAPRALRIQGPNIRKLRIELKLEVQSLDHVGALLKWVKGYLAAFFDAATGGTDVDGWSLGLSPSEEDIALVLIDAPYLDGIMNVSLHEIVSGKVLDWPKTIAPTDIVILDEDPVRIQFETVEMAA